LAKGNESFKVLLLEAGGSNSDANTRIIFDRYTTFFTSPEYNWGYKTVPQPELNGRDLGYDRGKGLGGSSSINFACFTIGPKADYDRWAKKVDDETFNWENAQRRYAELVNFHQPTDPGVQKYVHLAEWKRQQGPFSVEYPSQLEGFFPDVLESVKEAGFELNPDINSGNPLGVAVCPTTASKSRRSTAASTFLEPAPANLTVKTNSPVAKVLLEGKKAIGVETLDGVKCEFPLQRKCLC
jgi:choline dehydrogenase-like flavoprotein